MTYFAFLGLLLTTMVSAAPAPQDDSAATTAVCKPGTTVCVDVFDGCGKTGGCYDACQPTSYSAPPCSQSSWILDVSPTSASSSPTLSSAQFVEVAEKLVDPVVDTLPTSTQVFAVSISSSAIPSFAAPTIDSVKGPSVVDVEAPIKASITFASIPVAANIADVACGRKTSCWDAVTSLNANCPRVRYGGCYDVCRGDPKTLFTPKPCKPARL